MCRNLWFVFGLAACQAQGFTVDSRPPGDGPLLLAAAVDPLLAEAWTAESNLNNTGFGYSVSSAGDVNGDGYGNVVVGAIFYGEYEGRAYLYLGSASGLEATEAWTAESNQATAFFGYSVSSAGDVNGDGYGDVVVGAPNYDVGVIDGVYDEGRAYLYLGSASGLETIPAWTADSNQQYAGFGLSVSSAGDVNGDGYGDVVVGAPYYDTGNLNVGSVSLYLGSLAGLEATAAWTAESNQSGAWFGASVSSAGDVNGDGYGDVVVGAEPFDNVEYNEGRAQLYLGSAAGLETTPAWTAESNQVSALFGCSVSSAGDVNGDGYGDVVVGAYGYDNGESGEGRAYLYLGSAVGLEATAAWTAESNQDDAFFGYPVSSAGDVNGDGYGDIVVGAAYYDNGESDEGRAYLYLGSAAGLQATAAWTEESDQVAAYFGASVSSAGDVNGDGLGDVLVGAHLYDNVEENEGRTWLYIWACGADAADSDGDDIADPCDACPGFDDLLDADLDGVPEDCDSCPEVANPGQEDDDGDGIGEACDVCPLGAPDADADGSCESADCDDSDPTVYPGAPELCDSLDNACAGSVPADEVDADGDGVFVCARDCDDSVPTSYPGAPELCDGVDNACRGSVPPDEMDADSDGWSVCAGDCNDGDPARNPDLTDVCDDRVDNDCDGVVDQECAVTAGSCRCDGAGGPGGAPFAVLTVLASIARRRREGNPSGVRVPPAGIEPATP